MPPRSSPRASYRDDHLQLVSELRSKLAAAARGKVGAGTGVRYTPTLTFVRDTVPDAAHRMEELLARARAADADLARVRQNAKPAGDPDPYRMDGGTGEPGASRSGPDADDAEESGDHHRRDR